MSADHGQATGAPRSPSEETRVVVDVDDLRAMFGVADENLRTMEEILGVRVSARGNEVQVGGSADRVRCARELLQQVADLQRAGRTLSGEEFRVATRLVGENSGFRLRAFFLETSVRVTPTRAVSPKSLNQKRYLECIRLHDLTIGIGPAGTGKTYLAMAMAVQALSEGSRKRTILARPAVEAGEKLGFLPGDMQEKVHPYLRPLYDALNDMLDPDLVARYLAQGTIEVAPIAFMRGRTLNDSFVILDEAQNTTSEQMKMFLTRIGFNSRVVVTGDVTQVDLPQGRPSGLREVAGLLDGIPGIEFVYFDRTDVVRHPLVQRIIAAYESLAERQGGQR